MRALVAIGAVLLALLGWNVAADQPARRHPDSTFSATCHLRCARSQIDQVLAPGGTK